MSTNLNDYSKTTADWRRTLRQNSNRTYIIITIFFLIYIGLGILIDLVIVSEKYPTVPLSTLTIDLIRLKIFPIATCVCLAVAGISLFVCYLFYDKLMLLGTDYKEITAETAETPAEKQLFNIINEMVIAASLNYLPKIYIINADYMNAFASGYSEKSAMVAITRGLLEKLNREELAAVMAHEISHIRHLDIKLTLTASLLSNLILIAIDLLFRNIIYGRRRSSGRGRGGALILIIIALRYLLPVINLLLILYLSRTRELMADAGSVQMLRSNEPLAKALLKIQNDHTKNLATYQTAYRDTPHENVRREAYFFDPMEAGIADISSFNDIFSTHPSVEARLKALGYKKKDNE